MRLPDDVAVERAIAARIEIERIEREEAKRQAELAKGNRQQRREAKARARRRK